MEIPWLIIIIVFLASTIFATFGFGDALLALPFLAMTIGLQKATPLLAISGFTLAICLMGSGYKYVRWKEALKLVLGSLCGVPIGVWLLKHADKEMMQVIVGLVISFIALYNIFKPSLVKIEKDSSAPIFGFIGGVLGGAFNTSAPPVVMYGSMRGWSPQMFVGMMQAFFLPTDIFVISGHIGSGLLDKVVLQYYLWCLPFLLLAVYLGHRLKKKIPIGQFQNGVFVLIFISGILLVVKSLLG
ncbi:MAG: sulfite exporter TauE/SafE family protein [Chitinophagales bacterium]|nr:sulfite exporter TauE/SafE family protein [Chitinophagales bacterium]MCZ2393605.1 sulfite exporter TauE/SafE family protein [Chitinophagales bacterium]